MTDKLYTVDDVVASCNACGAYTLTRIPSNIKHYPNCGGRTEVEKWDRYYSDPEWEKATLNERRQEVSSGLSDCSVL